MTGSPIPWGTPERSLDSRSKLVAEKGLQLPGKRRGILKAAHPLVPAVAHVESVFEGVGDFVGLGWQMIVLLLNHHLG